jgi:HlyD family secretion protein
VRVAARSLSGQPSIVARLLVAEGDSVRAGQPIAELDSLPQLAAALRLAAARVSVARRRLEQIEAGSKPSDVAAQAAEVDRLRVELEVARKDQERHAALGRNITAIELDRLRLRAETTARAVAAAEQRLASLREVRGADVSLARAELDEAVSNEARARAEHAAGTLRAPADGRVLEIHARPGEIVGTEGVMELAPAGPMYAVAEVPESDAGRVRAGQRATVSGDGLERPLSGTVERVGTKVLQHRLLPVDPARFSDARVVEVRVRLDDSAAIADLIHLRVELVIQP